MELTVKLEEVLEAIELHTFRNKYFYSKKDGEVYFVTEEELAAAEDDYDLEDFPEWQWNNIKLAEEILYSMDYIELPDDYDIDVYEIMEDFCLSIDDDKLRKIMYNSIQGRGAFRRFEDNVHKYGIIDDWYDFQENVYMEIAKQWCNNHGIKYIEEEKIMTNKSKLTEYDEEERLEDAKNWITNYQGKDLKRVYCKRYGVDIFVAQEELNALDYFDNDVLEDDIFDGGQKPQSYMESQFEYIAGYTSGGVPYGIKKEDNDIDDQDMELPF